MSSLVRFEADREPRNLGVDPPMSDDELERFCQRNGDAQIERTSEGAIRVNPPAGALTADGNSEMNRQLRNGTGPIEGFVLDLTKVWRCYEV